jgi:hypothetical protein
MAADSNIYIPVNHKTSQPILFAVNNNDFDADTADGKHTQHGTVIVAIQTLNNAALPPAFQPTHEISVNGFQVTAVPPDSYLHHFKGSVMPKTSPTFQNYIHIKFADMLLLMSPADAYNTLFDILRHSRSLVLSWGQRIRPFNVHSI